MWLVNGFWLKETKKLNRKSCLQNIRSQNYKIFDHKFFMIFDHKITKLNDFLKHL